MKSGARFRWFRRIACAALGLALIAAAWNYAPREPAFREPNSSAIPLAFSSDGKILAAADAPGHSQWREGIKGRNPGRPIHMLRAFDLAPAGPPIKPPPIVTDWGEYYPEVEAVEFSPNGGLLAVLQRAHSQKLLELHLIQLPGGKVWKSFQIPFPRWRLDAVIWGGVARRLFSPDGRMLVWWEDETLPVGFRETARVWDVTEGRERFAAEGVGHPVLSPDSRLLAAVEQYKPSGPAIACRIYDVSTGKVLHSLGLPGDRAGLQPWPEFSQDGRWLVITAGNSHDVGESVVVFDVHSGKKVFEAKEARGHFVDGPILVTVKDNALLFRATNNWEVQARTTFALHPILESSIVPEPVPGQAGVLVFRYGPAQNDPLEKFSSYFGLKLDKRNGTNWVDAMTGEVTQFKLNIEPGMRTAISPDGSRLVVGGGPGATIWDLPPRRSWIPTLAVGALLATVGGLPVVRRWIGMRHRPSSSVAEENKARTLG
jgi:hypothetical protein